MMKKIALWLAVAAVMGGIVGVSALQELKITMEGQSVELKDLFNVRDGIKKNVFQEEKLAVTQLEFLTIESVSENIEIIYEERADLLATLEGSVTQSEKSRLPKMLVSSVGNRAEVKIEELPILNGFNFVYDLKMTIKVPQTMKPSLEVSSVSGNIEAPFYKNAVLKTVSGNIQARGNEKAALESRSTSGNIRVEGLVGEMTLETISGEIQATLDQLQSDVSMRTTSGECLLELKEKPEGVSFKGESVSGNIDVKLNGNAYSNEEGNVLTAEIGNGKFNVDMYSVSGNLSVTD